MLRIFKTRNITTTTATTVVIKNITATTTAPAMAPVVSLPWLLSLAVGTVLTERERNDEFVVSIAKTDVYTYIVSIYTHHQ